MPVLFPPPMPRFSCSSTRTSGKRSRTTSRVPSVEPWSTTITSCPRTDSRHCSSHGSAFQVTTTTERSATAFGDRCAPIEDVLPEDHGEPGRCEHDRHHEEEEPASEGEVRGHVQVAHEADEEGFAHAETVDCERHEHDEEEHRFQHDVREHREVDAD